MGTVERHLTINRNTYLVPEIEYNIVYEGSKCSCWDRT